MLKSTKVGSLFPSTLALTLILLALVPLGRALTGPQVMAPTSRYISVVSYTVNTATTYSTTALSWNPLVYMATFTYPKSSTGYRMACSIAQINYVLPPSRQLQYTLDTGTKYTTGVQMLFYAKFANKINLLVLNTVTIQPGFMTYYFYYLTIDFYGMTFSPGEFVTESFTGLLAAPIPTASASLYHSIIGIDLIANSNFDYGFQVTCTQTASTDVNMKVTSIGGKPTTINSIYVIVFIYRNVQLATASPAPARYTLGKITSNSGSNTDLFWNSAIAKPYNILMGLSAFKFNGNNFFNFASYVNPGVAVMANSTNVWLQLTFPFVLFQYTYCPDTIPYLMVSTSVCHDVCPVRFASNASDYQCDACPTYDCYYCGVNGKCTECSATVDYRYMDNTTMRCLPLPGYYNNGVSQAVPCVATSCLTCTSATSCLSCYTGKYLSGTTCIACMANCLNCTSATTCITCDSYYVFTSGACVANCSNVTYCATCTVSSGIVCSGCSTGYSLVNDTCMEVCGDGMLVTPEACDDHNIIPGDGCSPTCQLEVGFVCNTASPTVCQPCSTNCNTCTSTTVCTACATGYSLTGGACILDCTVITYCDTCSYNSILPGTQCDSCQDGYEIQLNNTCAARCGDGKRVGSEECDDGGNTGGNGCSATCTIETGYYCTDTFPSPSTCGNCISDCDVCSDATTCTTCIVGYTYDNTTSPASPTCKADCTSIPNCYTCSYVVATGTNCLTCSDGYYDNGSNGCDPQCGDGKRVASQGCDDHDNDDNDGCSATCTVESGYYCTDTFPNPSICSHCVSFCVDCSNGTSCTTCSPNYAYNSTLNQCTIDCSIVSQCLTCNYPVDHTVCLSCNPGYHVDNSTNTCNTSCGDGFRTPDEACDDGNSNNSDGCSSACVQEPAFFCVDTVVTGGVKSSCTACMSNCLTCNTTTDCGGCSTAYTYNSTACVIDCTPISLCATCDYPGSLNCLSCSSGYYPVSNVCQPRCGDGILVVSEACDDGNTNNNDGCSSNCTLEPSFLCTNGTTNTTCIACIAHCIDCTGDANDCQACATDYIYKSSGSNITCDIDCQKFSNCLQCTFTLCTSCITGYSIDSSNTCTPTCGDGVIKIGEACDDGNKVNGDGCSNTCQLESNFQCVSVSMKSVCSILSMDIAFASLIKVPTTNSITVTYDVTPASFPALSTVDWSTVIQQNSNLSITFSSFNYDSSTGQLAINADYSQPLDLQMLQLGFNFPLTAPFNLLNATNTSTLLVADNNLKLGVYSSDDYGQAGMVGYIAMGASAAATALFLMGFLKGKLVGLQCVTVFQLTFLSLLTCQNLSPSFYGLSYLGYSCGYNLKSLQKSSVNIERRFSPVGHSQPFLENYNLTAILFLLPLILSLVLALVNRFRYNSSNEFLLKHSQLLRGQGCFYGLMFSAYQIVISLGIEVQHMGAGMMGLAVGAALMVTVIVFGVLLRRNPELFGEFTEKFNKDSCIQSGYYCILIGERVITAGCLVMAFFSPLGAVIVGMLVIQMVLVVGKKPYAGERGWLRPFLNLLFSVIIQALFILTPMLSSMPIMSRYAPLAIEAILVVVLAYNIYYFVQQLRGLDQPANQAINQEEDLINEEMNKLGLFQKQMLNGPSLGMLDKTNASIAQQQNDPDSPSRLAGNKLSDVREKLNKVKLSTVDPNNISFAASSELPDDFI